MQMGTLFIYYTVASVIKANNNFLERKTHTKYIYLKLLKQWQV